MKRRKKKTGQHKAKIGTAGQESGKFSEKEIIAMVNELAEPLCETEGMELVHAEYQREAGGRVLRLYIDKPLGILLDDCVRISRELNDLLDVHFENIGHYRLEVTSPGADRPLGKASHFEKFRGRSVRIRAAWSPDDDIGHGEPEKGNRKSETYKGVLLGMSGDRVNLSVAAVSEPAQDAEAADNRTILIPLHKITQARLVPEKS